MSHQIETLIDLVEQDIKELRSKHEQKPLQHPKSTHLEIVAFNALVNNFNITI